MNTLTAIKLLVKGDSIKGAYIQGFKPHDVKALRQQIEAEKRYIWIKYESGYFITSINPREVREITLNNYLSEEVDIYPNEIGYVKRLINTAFRKMMDLKNMDWNYAGRYKFYYNKPVKDLLKLFYLHQAFVYRIITIQNEIALVIAPKAHISTAPLDRALDMLPTLNEDNIGYYEFLGDLKLGNVRRLQRCRILQLQRSQNKAQVLFLNGMKTELDLSRIFLLPRVEEYIELLSEHVGEYKSFLKERRELSFSLGYKESRLQLPVMIINKVREIFKDIKKIFPFEIGLDHSKVIVESSDDFMVINDES